MLLYNSATVRCSFTSFRAILWFFYTTDIHASGIKKIVIFYPTLVFVYPTIHISIQRILKRKGPIQLKVLNIDFLDCRKLWRPVVLALCTLSYYSTLDSRLQEANQWPNCILCKLRKVTVKCCKCKCHIFMTISLH